MSDNRFWTENKCRKTIVTTSYKLCKLDKKKEGERGEEEEENRKHVRFKGADFSADN